VRIFAVLLLGILTATGAGAAVAPEICGNQLNLPRHPCIEATDPQASCSAVVAREPKRLTATIALCDLALAEGDFERADALLDEANRVHRADNYALNLIRLARSNVAEAHRTGDDSGGDLDVLAEYLQIRCESLNNLDACAELVGLRPGDPAPLNRLAQAALADGEYVWAIRYFERSLDLDASQAEVIQALEQARDGRKAQVDVCLTAGGSRARDACVAGRLPGAADEQKILIRLGDLSIERRAEADAREFYTQALTINGDGPAGGRLRLLERAGSCLGGVLGDCEAALGGVPSSGSFADMRHQLNRQRCLLLLDSVSLVQARSPCEAAMAEDPQVRTELGRLLATKALGECQSLYSDGAKDAAVAACRTARELLSEPALVALADNIVKKLERGSAVEEVSVPELPEPPVSDVVVREKRTNAPEREEFGAVVTY
jgi:tetratricopeptide (TPR) repeat protein